MIPVLQLKGATQLKLNKESTDDFIKNTQKIE